MKNTEDIQNELKILSPTLQSIINNHNVFKVPEHYFDENPVHIMSKLLISNNTDSEIPTDYFSNFANSVLEKIKSEALLNNIETYSDEINALSPTLAAIGNKNILSVPDHYFQDSSARILEKVFTAPAPAKVVQMRPYTTLRYLIAAVCIGILGFGAYQIFNKSLSNDSEGNNGVVMAQANKIIQSGNIDAAFNQLSEADITTYFNDKGVDIQTALAASAVNNPELPEPVEYLIDDNTLDEFLESNNLTN